MIKFLIFALSFLGLLAGIIISLFTKEELKPGKKYFMLFEKIILLSISLVIIFYVEDFFTFFILGLLAGFIFRRVYFYYGLALPLASGSFLLILSSLVFIFGLPEGSLLYYKLKKKFVKEAIWSGVFFLAGILLSYFFSYTSLLMLISGVLIVISILGLKKFWIFPANSLLCK